MNIIVHLHVELGAKLSIRYRMISIRRSPRPPPAKWRVLMASCHGASNSHIFLHHVENPPSQPADSRGGGGGGRYEWRLGSAHFHNEYSYLMISPKLSLFFLLIPSPL
jgi:hypothetical protein